MSGFWAMGGYATYVWPAYGLFLLVLLADYLAPWWRRRALLAELRRRLARQEARQPRRQASASTPIKVADEPHP